MRDSAVIVLWVVGDVYVREGGFMFNRKNVVFGESKIMGV